MTCFDKTRRLLKKSDYEYVFAQAKKVATSEFIFLYRANSLGYARLGLALSKKAIAKAHDRNRLKRLLRETFRIKQLPAIDVVVLARPGVAKVENKTIIAKLGKTWDKLIDSSAI
ncbi:ribonuclease P protein component [Legionella jordanis]|uniref:Ribonuclease P protein component n=1 Tax=Legionella jordanis TaxID=456 RepID=A0A0W0VCP3_9GAMM|nr:ribonuclease P protein component [Legionella jordanis]KTD17875.1 ribonuclease P protein component (RNase P) [Legionella jordanis]RMX02425.1 ribonuclease P protein component [Legionella jordanis]RMX21732.1 ribonuclease P protein component [Legionella jordanis]VEH14034.1 ribonuclease P protein component (RNase P) [Legionella jordanis]HAT8713846.1 ribonuclease P protein component [Legionella jordanis]